MLVTWNNTNFYNNSQQFACSQLTCDQVSLFFLSGRERNAWYNYLTIRLLLVHILDFSLIGQEKKGYLELSHDWLPV